jgi:hypothetical protein
VSKEARNGQLSQPTVPRSSSAAHPTEVARDAALILLELLIAPGDLDERRNEVTAAQLRAFPARLHGLLAQRTDDRQHEADVLVAVALAQDLGDRRAVPQPGVVEGVAKRPQLRHLVTWPLHERTALLEEVDHCSARAHKTRAKQTSRKAQKFSHVII